MLFLNLLTSCGKENYANIPNVTVNLQINANTDLVNLGIGQMITITPDSASTETLTEYSILNFHNSKLKNIVILGRTYGNGLILYRKDVSTYEVYDRTCTYNGLTDHCGVNVNVYEFTCTCPCCKSVFMISDEGIPAQGSMATMPLVQYHTSLDDIRGVLSIWK